MLELQLELLTIRHARDLQPLRLIWVVVCRRNYEIPPDRPGRHVLIHQQSRISGKGSLCDADPSGGVRTARHSMQVQLASDLGRMSRGAVNTTPVCATLKRADVDVAESV